ncbi:hypothetical protein oki361_15930 [Helicobacter pylori]
MFFGIKKLTFYFKLNKSKKSKSSKEIEYKDQIINAFYECDKRYGRIRLSLFLKKSMLLT